jgi:hypothetical protein
VLNILSGITEPIDDLDTNAPKYIPTLLNQPDFDIDCRVSFVSGNLTIQRADPETGIDIYRIYFGQDETTKQVCVNSQISSCQIETKMT